MGNPTLKILRDYFLTALIAVFCALLIRNYVIEAYRIPSPAMKPTLLPGDVIFVAKWPYRILENTLPKAGDVVIFSEGGDLDFSNGSDYIKRVIGLPGDRVAVHKGEIILNGSKLSSIEMTQKEKCMEEKLPTGKSYEICAELPLLPEFGPIEIPKDSVFVVGDLRSQPTVKNPLKKGRVDPNKKPKGWGVVPISTIKGKAMWIWLSIDPHVDFGESSHWSPRLRWNRMFREVQ